MNTFKTIIVAALFIVISSFFFDFNYQEYATNYPVQDNDIKQIQVNIEEAEVVVTTAESTDFIVKFKVNQEDEKLSKYYSIVEDNKLIISQYNLLEDRFYHTKPKVEITVPKNFNVEDLHITTNKGAVLVDGVSAANLNVQTGEGKIDIKNTLSTNGIFTTKTGNISIIDSTVAKLAIETTSGNTEISKIISDTLSLKAIDDNIINIFKIVANKVYIDAPKSSMELTVSDQLKYKVVAPEKVERIGEVPVDIVDFVKEKSEIQEIYDSIASEVSETQEAEGVTGNDGIEYYYFEGINSLNLEVVGE